MEINELFKKIAEDKYLEKQLTTAVTAQYCRQTSLQQKDLVFNTLDLITGKQNYRGYSCNQCVFRAFNTVGKEYLKWKQRTQTEVIQTPENNTETIEATVTEPKKPASKTLKKTTTKKPAAKTKRTKSGKVI